MKWAEVSNELLSTTYPNLTLQNILHLTPNFSLFSSGLEPFRHGKNCSIVRTLKGATFVVLSMDPCSYREFNEEVTKMSQPFAKRIGGKSPRGSEPSVMFFHVLAISLWVLSVGTVHMFSNDG
jgi:hypothetical protein